MRLCHRPGMMSDNFAMMQSALLAHLATSHDCAAAQPLTKTQLSFLWAKHDLVRQFFGLTRRQPCQA